MIILACNNITKNYGVESILNNINLQIAEKDRVGIVGVNGAGKTTLLKILAGIEQADSGSVSMPASTTIGYLKQRPDFDNTQTVWSYLMGNFKNLTDMEDNIRELEKKMTSSTGTALDRLMEEYGNLTEKFASDGGYEYKSLIRGALNGLGIEEYQFEKPLGQLSGGQQTRVALAELLLRKHSLLLLDEPTNYLDIKAVEWLEGFLGDYDGAIMVISHDRFFVDKVCNRIFEIREKSLYEYRGNYSDFVIQKEALLELEVKNYKVQQKEIQRQQEIIRQLRSFNREKSVRRANSREKLLSRIIPAERPNTEDERVRISLDPLVKSGMDVLFLEELSMSFNDVMLFCNVNLSVYRGDIIGIIGPNGVGKTTLFNIISGRTQPLSGVIRKGHNVNIEYYHQQQENLNLSNTVLDEVWNDNPKLDNTRIRNILAAFLFKGDDIYKAIETLSGGERSRVALIKLMLSKSNLLLLDEPTNHLDIQSMEVLEDALIDYTGTVLVISHDRYFLDRVATKIAELSPDGISLFHGNYSYYRMKKQQQEDAILMAQQDSGPTKTALKQQKRKEREEREQRKLEKKKMQQVEQAIVETEERIQEIERRMCLPEVYSDHERMNELHMEMLSLKEALEELYGEWESFV